MTEERELSIRIPTRLNTVQKAELAPDSQVELASAIAPTVEHIASAAGLQLTKDQLTDLQAAFRDRGSISIRPGGDNMSATISVEVNSLNYTSKLAPVERLEAPIEAVSRTVRGARGPG